MRYFKMFFILLAVFNFTCRSKSSRPETLVKFEVFRPDEIILPYCGEYIPCSDNELFYLSVYNGDSDTIVASVTGNTPFVDNLLDYKILYCEIANGDTSWSGPIPENALSHADTLFPFCKKIYPLAIITTNGWLDNPNRWILVFPALHSKKFDEIGKNSFYKKYPLIVLTKDTITNRIIDVSQSFFKEK